MDPSSTTEALLKQTGEQNLRLDRYSTDRQCVHSWVCCAHSLVIRIIIINICKDDLYYRMFQDAPVLSEDVTKVYFVLTALLLGVLRWL